MPSSFFNDPAPTEISPLSLHAALPILRDVHGDLAQAARMAQPRTVALDAMGGDHGPEVVVPGAAISLVRHPSLSFILFGDEARIGAVLAQHPELAAKSRVVHTALVVAMSDKPSQALRRGKGSSMWLALEGGTQGEAGMAVLAG